MPKRISFRDCTNTCKSEIHANDVISAISLPSSLVIDKQIASFLNSTCCCFDSVKDKFGRNVLHITASCGRKDLCQWLIRYSNVDINARDYESGYTPLHRSILYGFISVAVSLMKLGAEINVKDYEDYCPIDLCVKNINVEFIPYLIFSKFATKDILSVFQSSKSFQKYQNVYDKDVSYNRLQQIFEEKQGYLTAANNIYFTEVYTWGMNQNYTNGFGTESSKTNPEYLEFFEKRNEIIIEVCMHKCHTLFVSLAGNVWSCGLGQGGRLGHPVEETVLIPRKISLSGSASASPLFCIKAAVGQDHSIFLCNDNQVLACGLNTYHQLGIVPVPVSVNQPKAVDVELWNGKVLGVAASTFHSAIWTDSVIYTCGLHAGQLGHPNSASKTFQSFKKVPSLQFHKTCITGVAASDGATVIATDANDIFLLSKYDCQKIEFRHIVEYVSGIETNWISKRGQNNLASSQDLVCLQIVLKIIVVGGSLDSKKVKSFSSSYRAEELKIAVLLWNGSVFLWTENETRFISCDFLVKHEIKVADMCFSGSDMMIVTRTGEAFSVHVDRLVKTFNKITDYGYTRVSYNNSNIIDEAYLLRVRKLANAHRAILIFSEPKGNNFAILQNRSADIPECIPVPECSTFYDDFEQLFHDVSEYDEIHDIVYQVETKSFAAHKYILWSCSEELVSAKATTTKNTTVIKNIHPDIFRELLLFAYTGSCNLLRVGECTVKVPKNNNERSLGTPVKYEDPIRLALKAARELKINKLIPLLEKFRYENECIFAKEPVDAHPIRLNFNRIKCKQLYDMKVKSQDGQVFNVHKCVLVARMEYFKLMLSGYWKESADNDFQIPVSGSVLQEIIEYLYTDTITKTVHKKDVNFWCSLLVAAEQFILPRLKEMSEQSLSQCLDVRNTVDVLLFAETMYADQLKNACFEFICINLPSFLCDRSLEKLSDDMLHSLTEFYRNIYRSNLTNNVPVYSNGCDMEKVINIGSTYPIEWEVFLESELPDELKKKPLNAEAPKKKTKRVRKLSNEPNTGGNRERRHSENENVSSDKSGTRTKSMEIYRYTEAEKVSASSPIPNIREEEWIEVEKQVKSVKTRLKINTAVRNCPEMIEQKENFVPLNKSSKLESEETPQRVTEEVQFEGRRSTPIKINIDLQNITPKLSQKQRKKLRTQSESSKADDTEIISPKNVWNVSPPPMLHNGNTKSNISDCWGSSKSAEPISFSAIMASEKKHKIVEREHKTVLKKETKKIESKSLQLTQIEDKAIQDLIAFYNAHNIDDENITVQRVIKDVEVPQWVPK